MRRPSLRFLTPLTSLFRARGTQAPDAPVLYHGTFDETLSRERKFLPLTHFGSQKAAEERIASKVGQGETRAAHIIPVRVDIRKPLELPDIGTHGIRTWEHLLRATDTFCDIPPMGKERDADGGLRDVTPAEYEAGYMAKYKERLGAARVTQRAILNRIFDEPQDMTIAQAKAELARDTLFDPGVIPPVEPTPEHCWRTAVMMQRMIRELESRGYDGVTYTNNSEDRGHVSHVVFRPEKQVRALAPLPHTRAPGEPTPTGL